MVMTTGIDGGMMLLMRIVTERPLRVNSHKKNLSS